MLYALLITMGRDELGEEICWTASRVMNEVRMSLSLRNEGWGVTGVVMEDEVDCVASSVMADCLRDCMYSSGTIGELAALISL